MALKCLEALYGDEMPQRGEIKVKSFPVRFQAMVKTIFDNSDKVIEIV